MNGILDPSIKSLHNPWLGESRPAAGISLLHFGITEQLYQVAQQSSISTAPAQMPRLTSGESDLALSWKSDKI